LIGHQGTKSTKKVKRKKILDLNQTKGFEVLVYLGALGVLSEHSERVANK